MHVFFHKKIIGMIYYNIVKMNALNLYLIDIHNLYKINKIVVNYILVSLKSF